ncbi:hypothetical protein Tco_1511380 [Tanacetum coccineum]
MSPGKRIPSDKSPGIPRICRWGIWQMVQTSMRLFTYKRRETYGNGDFDYDPYDDDMCEDHEILDDIQSICDNLDIKVRGRKKK